ncbi:TonB-dependent receptor plug domain-containing protein [Hymenobacter cheonanensis]|uniref:TonB-dependent receptor plug domain-containing protein n=1 Tax=Hymenobacter sp. CA2-7 TaxID=3063993 RepID=UPI002713532E|nr:TonB-dependent receptor [Hymenobacter sp. CA2-7]MDO7887277.1 TonB-dependent receptor [Hymenobacter sp. CA2-7]
MFRSFPLLLVVALGLPAAARAQSLQLVVRDSTTRQPLIGASVGVPGTGVGGTTDARGLVQLAPAPAPGTRLRLEALGYKARSLAAPAPGGAPLLLLLAPSAAAIDEVVVTATRTNSRIEDQPERVEVLGEEEMQEENGIKPGNIASLLGDIAGTQIQPTSPTTGNADLRIQGLQGQYSQILRDGLPLYGGFAGSFGILSVPPLDLRQIELLKGSNSTLYGGGAIAGLVNLVSKTPTLGTPQFTATLNQTTLNETNLNGFAAQRGQRLGYSLFVGLTRQQAVDVDGDGFVDVPRVRSLNVHPRLFYYPSQHSQLAVGYTGTFESRRGGQQQAVRDEAEVLGGAAYFVNNTSQRHTLDAVYTNDSVGTGRLTLKGAVTNFGRDVLTNTVAFKAYQTTFYTEASYLHAAGRGNTLVAGLNLNGEQLRNAEGRATPLLSPYTYHTLGVFVQDSWQPAPRFNAQAGLRYDHQNQYGGFVLPRLSALYNLTDALTARVNGGLGYRVPVPYVNSLDERDYPQVQPLAGLVAETSQGLNGDLNYQHTFANFGDEGEPLVLNINQSFFYTRLQNPLILPDGGLAGGPGAGTYQPGSGPLRWQNAAAPVTTRGLETYVRLRADETELYLGYVFTDARRDYDPANPHVELAARHKFAAVALTEIGAHFGGGIEASYTGQQYLSDGSTTPGYPIVAALLRYRTGPWTLVLNAENVFDYRQTRRERVVLPVGGSYASPLFRELWAPVEGRVVNLSLNWKFEK